MMIKQSSPRIFLAFAIVLLGHFYFIAHAEKISDYRLCGDRNCQTLLSKARTLARHKPTDPAFLPFERGEMINIYSKSAGSRQDLWGGELKGKRGYFPRSFVREQKVEYTNPQHVVETEHHVSLEERIHGRTERHQVPPNARTVQQGNRQPASANQHQTVPIHEDKTDVPSGDLSQNEKEVDEENKQVTNESVDETEVGDETELPDDEQEVEKTENVSPDGTVQPSGGEPESSKTENQENKDPTEIDETEISDEEIEASEVEDNTEAGETANVSETEGGEDEIKTGKMENVAETDNSVDETEIDKTEEELEPSKSKDETEINETELADKEEEAVTEETDKSLEDGQRDGSVDTNKLSEASSDKNVDTADQKVEAEKDKREEAVHPEVDETEQDDKQGSMLGSIWSDESQGKVFESGKIDINHISHGEHADLNPNPDINTGDHTDNRVKENVNKGDSKLHVLKNDGNLENLPNGDGSGRSKADENFRNYSKTKSDDQITEEGVKIQESDFEHSKKIENSKDTADVFLSKEDDSKNNLGNEQLKSDNFVNDIENGNIHLKDILKSSLPDGNDVHKYLVEHSTADGELVASGTSDRLENEIYFDEHESNSNVLKHRETQKTEKQIQFDNTFDNNLMSGDVSKSDVQVLNTDKFVESQEKIFNGEKLNQDASHLADEKIERKNVPETEPYHDLTIDNIPEEENEEAEMNAQQQLPDRKFESDTPSSIRSNTHADKIIRDQMNKGTIFDDKGAPSASNDETAMNGYVKDIDGPELLADNAWLDSKTTFNTEDNTHGIKMNETKTEKEKEDPDLQGQSRDTRFIGKQDIREKRTIHKHEDKPHSLVDEISKTDEESLHQHNKKEDVEDEYIKHESRDINIEQKDLDKHVNEADKKTSEEAFLDKQKLVFQHSEQVETVNVQVEDTQEEVGITEDKNYYEDATKDTRDEAVVGSFQKKEDEGQDIKTTDEGLPDRKKEGDTKAIREDTHEIPLDFEHREKNVEKEMHNIEKPYKENLLDERTTEVLLEERSVTNDFEMKNENEGNKFGEDDEQAEEILESLEKNKKKLTADGNGKQKDATLNVVEDFSKDDLKFVNDEGEVIQDESGKEQKSPEDEQKDYVSDVNVKEMEQGEKVINISKEEIGPDGNVRKQGEQFEHMNDKIIKEQEELNEQKMLKFEKLASGTMSVLATPTLSDSNTQTQSVLERATDADIASTESNKESDMSSSSTPVSETKMNVESVTDEVKEITEHIYTPAAVNQHLTGQTGDSTSQEVEATKQVEDGKDGGFVIDGTTFPADYFGEETASDKMQTTQQEIVKTSTVMDNSVNTPAGSVKPTKLFDVPADVEQTLLPPTLQQHEHDSNHVPNFNQQTDQRGMNIPENILATETKKEEHFRQEVEPSDKASVLQTSFGFATQSMEDTNTLPVDKFRVAVETEEVQNNETVSIDNVQEQVQPSLDQSAYKGDIFISRKPLSTEPAPAETTAEANFLGQEVGNEGKEVNENDIDESGSLSTTGAPDQNEPYNSDEHMFSRQGLDPSLDEEMKQSEDVFMKMLEPYLRTLINMLPPSLQTVLEQEPVGMSPTLTMLVSLISTNVLALLTCLGCVCKSKKKPDGRKDPLVVIRDLEEKLFIATKEKENLEDDLQIKNKKMVQVEKELNSQQSTTGTVETDLKTIRLHNETLKKKLAEVKEELEDYKQDVTEKCQVVAYKESELQTYQAEVQTLTQRAQDAEVALQKTSQGLGEKSEELRASLEQVQSLSEQIHQLGTSKQQLQDEAVHWSEKVKDLTEQIEQFSTDSKRMQEDLAFKENELEVLRDCFLQVKAFQGEEMKEETVESPDLKEKLKQMMDVSRVNASLRSVEEERDVLHNKLLIEVESRKELEDQVQVLKRKFESHQTDKMKAERQCQEAQTKLEVLSKYFKEKEAELTRQLGEQEVLKNQNISKLQSSDSITIELSKENEVYRQQIEDLKTEISKAERDFRSQIAANEKKAHENWLATRAAERELKESRHECGMLRQKLTDLERKLMQGPPPGLIRPITHRAMPPPGMMNGPPPPPPPERPGSRGEDDYRASPVGPDRMPPLDRRHPPGPMGPRPPPPPLDAMSPPPYAIRPPFPPDRRSPPSFDRYPLPRGPRPPFPRPPPPRMRSPPPLGSISSEHDDSRQDPISPYNRAPQGNRDRGPTRHQSQV